ncbi:MAG TPA: serine/threonine-protein kinase, partial [Pirellulales bacterium]|nr:serine/threonine-protein kinase [Pirellulales bacterium]
MATMVRGPWEGLTIAEGRYQQLTTIGEGGMGYVYRALDRNLKIPVAIKTPRRALLEEPAQILRFEQEIGALVQLSFPHIVPVIDVGRHDEQAFAVIRYLQGGSLQGRAVDAHGRRLRLAAQSLGDWLPQIAKALDLVHDRGYLHRDVKPSNILFDQHDQVYLSDFGLIKVLDEAQASRSRRLTGEGFIVGTLDYMAPELLSGAACDGRADQYALAITVYELLSGDRPFEWSTPAAAMLQHLSHAPQPLSARVPQLPAAISDAVQRAMAKDPRQRFVNCAAFADAMLRAAATAVDGASGRPVTSQPPGGTNEKTRSTATLVCTPDTARSAAGEPPAPTMSLPNTRSTALSARQSGWRRRAWLAAAAVVLLGSVAACSWTFFGWQPDHDGGSYALTMSSNSLPERVAAWQRHADRLERAVPIDSQPLL